MPKSIGTDKTATEERAGGWPWRGELFFTGTATLIYLFRSSQYLLKPQLYAEDGAVWLADAYNLGIRSLIIPYNAFFHSAERVMGYFVALLPLQYAPLILNISAWFTFTIFVYYLFSPRTKILTNIYERVFVLISIGLVANVDELFFNFSNSVFLLGATGLLILIASEPRTVYTKVLERFIFTIASFTLVFAWLYLPIVLIERYRRKQNANFYLYCAAGGAILQTLSYLSSAATRSSATIQELLSRYTLLEIYNQIIIPAVRFARVDVSFEVNRWSGVAIATMSVGLFLLGTIYVFRIGNKQIRYLLFFFAAMTIAALANPLTDSLEPVKSMAVTRWGDRYFIFGIIGLGVVFSKLSFQVLTPVGRNWFLVTFFLFGLFTSWDSGSLFIEKEFRDYRKQLTEGIVQLELGAPSVTIPINPNGTRMRLQH